MPQLEFQDKSVKAAVAKACQELNIEVGNLNYKIISHGSSGIFGLVGSRNAKIKVTLPPASEEKQASASELAENAEAGTTDYAETNTESPPDLAPNEDQVSETQKDADPDESALSGQSFLQHLVDTITPDTVCNYTEKNKKITYTVTGGNSAILIGKHGQTLEALQFLTDRAVNQKRNQRLSVEVDVAGYQAKRRQALVDQAKRMANKANQSKKPVTIGPMRSHERRVIHMTLRSDPRVRTQSTGQGALRKLKIYPKKQSAQTDKE